MNPSGDTKDGNPGGDTPDKSLSYMEMYKNYINENKERFIKYGIHIMIAVIIIVLLIIIYCQVFGGYWQTSQTKTQTLTVSGDSTMNNSINITGGSSEPQANPGSLVIIAKSGGNTVFNNKGNTPDENGDYYGAYLFNKN